MVVGPPCVVAISLAVVPALVVVVVLAVVLIDGFEELFDVSIVGDVGFGLV